MEHRNESKRKNYHPYLIPLPISINMSVPLHVVIMYGDRQNKNNTTLKKGARHSKTDGYHDTALLVSAVQGSAQDK